ncbi:10 TM acyl transferase domain found in Cas1p-domain-containing protein [Tribonema minus]|uniref:10 TM acyl transferase domain found in Cas1p-domain-containing protein n=1 Tax=Tribonema minus TaxID=303371 RepID=A0A836C8X4_9STRA|nr:10 TM acyl transferase domain found in Cas1p-domain-containing protein [Tribonema minus]
MESPAPLALLLVLGGNAVLALALTAHGRCRTKVSEGSYSAVATDDGIIKKAPAKQLSKPLCLELESIQALSMDLLRLGAVLGLAYCCEKHPPFPHSAKASCTRFAHDMDTFWTMVTLLAVSCAFNIRKGKSTEVLNREQTEEWKGWMQFIFLLYHYFSAHEVYNSVRVMITSYVWMTGFGNFSFFYMKGDYSLVRVLQMLWRLNFLVTLLCLTFGNTYILYYICPLHTFYFLVVYAVMRVLPSANYTTAVRWKLAVAAAVIYLVWDADLGLFQRLFFFLGSKPVVGAGSGTMWEWYFRSSLDHWSTFLGMIFALNFPVTALWIKKVEAMPPARQWAIKGAVAAALLSAFVWWAAIILPQPKLQYNSSNAYFGVAIPLLTYIFLRNLSPALRGYYVEPLHSIGKTTLETYLMQHHVWLTSNAKTALTLVPGSPRLNMIVAGVLYVLVSRELYRLTMSLRGMLLPDARAACLRNLGGILALFALALGAAALLQRGGAGALSITLAACAAGVAAAAAVHIALLRAARPGGSSGGGGGSAYDGGLMRPATLAQLAVCLALVLGGVGAAGGALTREGGVAPSPGAAKAVAAGNGGGAGAPAAEVLGPADHCLASINRGAWETTIGACTQGHTLYCNYNAWRWVDVPDDCHFAFLAPGDVRAITAHRHLVFIGDSAHRMTYYAALRALGEPTPESNDATHERHADITWNGADGTHSASFLWAPYTEDVVAKLDALAASAAAPPPAMIVMGGGLWDALHVRSLDAYAHGLEAVAEALAAPAFARALRVWVMATAVAETHLTGADRQEWLKEERVREYREVARGSVLMAEMSAVLDGHALTAPRAADSYDGLHYAEFVYDALAQLVVNVARHYGWGDASAAAAGGGGAAAAPPAAAKRIGSMSHPLLGLLVVLLAAVMMAMMDAYHGLSRLALSLLGGGEGLTWEEAYGPILAKIKRPLQQQQQQAAAAALAQSRGDADGSGSGGGGAEQELACLTSSPSVMVSPSRRRSRSPQGGAQ